MLRAVLGSPDNPLIMMGLVEGNVRRLKSGQPIHVELKSFGLDLPGGIGIMYGETEADLIHTLKQAGVVGLDNKIEFDPSLAAQIAIREQHEKILIATVGLPRSGKTTWATSQAYPIVCPDAIRLAIHGQRFIGHAEPFVWATAKAMVRALFLAGHDTVVLDATNNTRKRTDEWKSKEWGTYFKVIDTDYATCIERAEAEGDNEIVPIITKQAMEHEPLADDEPRWP